MPPMTLTEKSLTKAAGRDQVAADSTVWVNVDVLVTHATCRAGGG